MLDDEMLLLSLASARLEVARSEVRAWHAAGAQFAAAGGVVDLLGKGMDAPANILVGISKTALIGLSEYRNAPVMKRGLG